MPSHTKSIYLSILRLGCPILIGQLGSIVVGFADTAMVGHYATASLSAASFVNNLFNVTVFALLGFSYGLTPLVGALFSQGKTTDIGSLMRGALIANVLFLILILLIMGSIYLSLDSLGQPPELIPLIRPYFLIVMASMIPLMLFNMFAQWSYAINRTKLPMWIILISNLLNILGNWLLIYGHCHCPQMGLNGAGLSTLAARLFTAIALIWVFFGKKEFNPYARGFRLPHHTLNGARKVIATSLPVALQMAFESGSFTVAAVMAGWLGALELAAFQVIVILGTLGFCVYYSIAAAISVLVANARGLANRPLMRRIAFRGYHILLALATCSSLIFIFFGRHIITLCTPDTQVITLSLSLILPLVLYQYGDATQITFANALRGTSHVSPMMWISILCYGIVGIPASYILAFPLHLHLYGIILSFSVSLFLAGFLFLRSFILTTKHPHT